MKILNKAKRFASKVVKAVGMLQKPHKMISPLLDRVIKVRARGLNPSHDTMQYKKFAELGYASVNDSDKIHKTLDGTGYHLDPSLSHDESKVFVNPKTKQVTIAYRGTALNKKSRMKDLLSDWAITTGTEKKNRRFQQSAHHFNDVLNKYEKDGYTFNTTGHSLGGQIAKHVNDKYRGKVKDNVVFSRGTGFLEPFRRKYHNTVDISNRHDLISLGARLQGGKQIIEKKNKNLLESHNLGALFN